MSLDKHYEPTRVESRLRALWEDQGTYGFSHDSSHEVFSIDTPPPTVSGKLHLGHVYSYSQIDFLARYRRMRGDNVFFPMGYDDNGLPTDRLVEKLLGIRSMDIERSKYIEMCLRVSEKAEEEYQLLWKRIGLSIDWNYSYRTIDDRSRRIAQFSFLDLFSQGHIYRKHAPAIWCTECQTAISQADLNDLELESEFLTLSFPLSNGDILPIATTRPELLAACVAIFVHPSDQRYNRLAGRTATVPLFGQTVPVLTDPAAEPEKGTGVVMCCTFGDMTDVAWWYSHNLNMVELINKDGTLSHGAGEFSGLSITDARKGIKEALKSGGHIISTAPMKHSIRVHERCDTPAEYIVTPQWFIRVIDQKESLLKAGEEVAWHPTHMQARYRAWVENLRWDWCISRQRYYGVQFPLWYCNNCNEVLLANATQLPVDPFIDSPPLKSCPQCGSQEFVPEKDVFDTWMTSSMTPQICGGWQDNPELYEKVFPFSLRPQAHEIIRTWAFYTIYKSKNHFNQVPWMSTAISGWAVAAEGAGKISKSKGGGPMPPLEMIELYSADAVRYWASSTSLGKDSIISEEKIQVGSRLLTKIWNVARFAERFLADYIPPESPPRLTPADQWILSRLQKLIERSTQLFENYDYSTAKSDVETFFWTEFADNYIEMCKQRLYDQNTSGFDGARFALYSTLLTLLKLLAPILPFITDEIYQEIFSQMEGAQSIHRTAWPTQNMNLVNEQAETVGATLLEVATFVRRYKSENYLPLGTKLRSIRITTHIDHLAEALQQASDDLVSITRAERLQILCEPEMEIPSYTSLGTINIEIEQ